MDRESQMKNGHNLHKIMGELWTGSLYFNKKNVFICHFYSGTLFQYDSVAKWLVRWPFMQEVGV